MGCQKTKEKFRNKISNLSKLSKQDTQYLIEQIIIVTHFEEKEIFHLLKKFNDLDPNEKGLISNIQLLEYEPFKYSPFKKLFLKMA